MGASTTSSPIRRGTERYGDASPHGGTWAAHVSLNAAQSPDRGFASFFPHSICAGDKLDPTILTGSLLPLGGTMRTQVSLPTFSVSTPVPGGTSISIYLPASPDPAGQA